MIHEFALDPEEVATWGTKEKFTQLYNAFGAGTPRIATRLPKKWREMVLAAARPTSPEDEIRLEEILNAISELQTRRVDDYDASRQSWLEAAIDAHDNFEFRATVSCANANGHAGVIRFEDLNNLNERWAVDVRADFDRCAAGFGACFRPMLRLGREIRFVDAHLKPELRRYQNVTSALLEEVARCPDWRHVNVQYICKHDDRAPPWKMFVDRLQHWPRHVIPRGMKLEIIRLEEIGRERFHDRFVLTNFGGAKLYDGLDEEQNPIPNGGGATVMRRDDFARRWQIYRKETTDFAFENSVVLTGV